MERRSPASVSIRAFSFDSVPLLLARATSGVRRVTITRAIDVTGTGPGDIDHVGYALWPDEFEQKIAAGRIEGHMGMPESIAAVAERLNIVIDRVEESWSTAVADFPVDSGTESLGTIETGPRDRDHADRNGDARRRCCHHHAPRHVLPTGALRP